jgi:hypothetical protein
MVYFILHDINCNCLEYFDQVTGVDPNNPIVKQWRVPTASQSNNNSTGMEELVSFIFTLFLFLLFGSEESWYGKRHSLFDNNNYYTGTIIIILFSFSFHYLYYLTTDDKHFLYFNIYSHTYSFLEKLATNPYFFFFLFFFYIFFIFYLL